MNLPKWMVKLSSSGGGVSSAEKSSGGEPGSESTRSLEREEKEEKH